MSTQTRERLPAERDAGAPHQPSRSEAPAPAPEPEPVPAPVRFVVLTGLSGAGRSLAADHLEDLGWPVVDNLPPEMVPQMVDLVLAPDSGFDRIALALGPGPDGQLGSALATLRERMPGVQVLFLEAGTDTLVRRFDASRRRHPLTLHGDEHLVTAIDHERELLAPVREDADVVLDTSALNVHELRHWIGSHIGDGERPAGMQTTVMSFGFKHGLPLDADLVLDCRFLPNPHWVEELRPGSGRDADVRDYVLGQEATPGFLTRIGDLLSSLVPAYAADGRSYLTVALGCTGGRHRSVALAEAVAGQLRAGGHAPNVEHRDVDR